MNDILYPRKMKGTFILKTVLCILVPALAARLCAMAYSNAATDVTVPEMFDTVLYYAYLATSCIARGAAYAAIQRATYRYSPAQGLIPLAIYSAVTLADCAARFLIDYIGGAINYREIVALINLSSEFFATVAIAFGTWILGVAIHHFYVIRHCMRKYSEKTAINAAVLLYFAVPFIRWIVTSLTFLASVEWIPTVDESRAIVSDGVSVFIFYAIVTFVGSRIALAVLRSGDNE